MMVLGGQPPQRSAQRAPSLVLGEEREQGLAHRTAVEQSDRAEVAAGAEHSRRLNRIHHERPPSAGNGKFHCFSCLGRQVAACRQGDIGQDTLLSRAALLKHARAEPIRGPVRPVRFGEPRGPQHLEQERHRLLVNPGGPAERCGRGWPPSQQGQDLKSP